LTVFQKKEPHFCHGKQTSSVKRGSFIGFIAMLCCAGAIDWLLSNLLHTNNYEQMMTSTVTSWYNNRHDRADFIAPTLWSPNSRNPVD